MMEYLFGARKKEDPKEAIIKLREQLLILEKKEAHQNKLISEQETIARTNANSRRDVALQAIKRKKVLEKQQEQLVNSRFTLESQVMAIESANLNYQTMNAMKQGAKAMKRIHAGLDADKVDKTIDEIQDQIALGDQVAEAIARPVGANADLDEDELEAELEALQQEEIDSKMITVEAPPKQVSALSESSLPSVISHPQAAVEEDPDDAELRQLQAEMAL